MVINTENIGIVIVNYNTPDLILRLYYQIRLFLENISVIIVDGSDRRLVKRGNDIIKLNESMKEILMKDDFVIHEKFGYNIHHGPGMDFGIKNLEKDHILLLDSDAQVVKNPIVLFNKYYKENYFCIGKCEFVNDRGCNVKNGIPYIHPSIMLINRKKYIEFNNPFIKHGAPCINFMKKVDKNELIDIEPKEIENYFIRGSKGTVSIFGYNL